MSERQHLEVALKAGDRALVNAHGGDHLAEAAAHMLLALQCCERERESREAARVPGTYKKSSVNFASAIHSLVSPSGRQQRLHGPT